MDLSCSYDDGYFDKDEQGWVTNGIGVSTLADGTVRIRRWGDRNGLDPYEQVTTTRIRQVFDELKLVRLEEWPWYFDLEKKRLVDGNREVSLGRRPAGGEWMTPARISSAIAFVFDVVAVLGARMTPPPFPGWPQRTTTDRYEFTGVTIPLEDGFTLELRYRPAISATSTPELCVWLTGQRHGASVVVTEKGECSITARGPLELHAAARALAAQWTWS